MIDNNIQKLLANIQSATTILLITHRHPDGDALGSLLAMQNFLNSQKKQVQSFCIDLPQNTFDYLPGINQVSNDLTVLEQNYDLVIILDCGDFYLTKVEDIVKTKKFKWGVVNIDHHYTNPQYADLNIVIPQASSTSEIIYQIMKIWKMKIDSAMATCLLTGIITDTNNFTNNATTQKSINAAAELLKIGANFDEITKANIYNKTIDILKLWGLVLKRIVLDKELNMVSTALFQTDLDNLHLQIEEAEGISNYLNNLSADIKFSLLLKDQGLGKVKGSLRTTREDIDVAQIAQAFGGGGHRKAAGFEVPGRVVLNNNQWQIIN